MLRRAADGLCGALPVQARSRHFGSLSKTLNLRAGSIPSVCFPPVKRSGSADEAPPAVLSWRPPWRPKAKAQPPASHRRSLRLGSSRSVLETRDAYAEHPRNDVPSEPLVRGTLPRSSAFMSASARQPVRSTPAISAFIPLLKPGRRFLSHFTDAPRGDWDCPTAAALSRLESGSLPGRPWQLIRPASNRQASRFDPHPPSRPLVLRYVWPF